MKSYWLYKDGKRFCYTTDRTQAENIARANGCTIVGPEQLELLEVARDLTQEQIDKLLGYAERIKAK